MANKSYKEIAGDLLVDMREEVRWLITKIGTDAKEHKLDLLDHHAMMFMATLYNGKNGFENDDKLLYYIKTKELLENYLNNGAIGVWYKAHPKVRQKLHDWVVRLEKEIIKLRGAR